MYFPNYGFRKTGLDQSSKSPASEDPSKSNIVNGSKHCSNLNDFFLGYLLILVEDIDLQKVSVSDMQNLSTVC